VRQQPINLVSVVSGAEAEARTLEEHAGLPASLPFAPERLLADFPAPALLLDRHCRLLGANVHAVDLVDAITRVADARLPALLSAAVANRRPSIETIRLARTGSEGDRSLELTLLPLAEGDQVHLLVLGRDTSFERNFTNALLASRQLFRDLVNCSSDFAWETRPDGAFGFVSARGALGYSARELNGRPARSLVHPRQPEGAPLPFESRKALDEAEVWLRRADGSAACLITSSVPVIGENGEWLGTRGVCRDVTEARERDAALRRAQGREKLLADIVDAIRSEIEPERMLGAAAESTALAMRAGNCWIFCSGDGVGLVQAASFAGPSGSAATIATGTVAAVLASRGEGPLFEQEVGEHLVLAALSNYRGRVNGALCVSRYRDEMPWDDDDRALVGGVAAQLGIALEQLATHERLERSSRTDELTKLFNRRAFYDDVGRRLSHLRRQDRRAALLYLDLDNFKDVNDHLGHGRGDEVLQQVGDILLRTSRAGDIIGRIGGDEFVIWLEEVDEKGAKAKARTLIEHCTELAVDVGTLRPALGASIGITLSEPTKDESVADLVARADRAMYQVKHHGKGDFALASAGSEPGEEGSGRTEF
jgi:diguanylate cyclase (GGDEF)-like protein/PAS domain S-box-containing protein